MTGMRHHTINQPQMTSVLGVRRTHGRQSLGQLATLAHMAWSHVYVVVDELSRRGSVRISRVGGVSMKSASERHHEQD